MPRPQSSHRLALRRLMVLLASLLVLPGGARASADDSACPNPQQPWTCPAHVYVSGGNATILVSGRIYTSESRTDASVTPGSTDLPPDLNGLAQVEFVVSATGTAEVSFKCSLVTFFSTKPCGD